MIADIDRPVDLARLLIEHGISLRRAHACLQDLARGESIALQLTTEDSQVLVRRFADLGIEASELRIPEVSVRAVRSRLNLSQAEFALRFGFEIDTVQNWDQGRNQPDAAARLLLAIIDRDPAFVEAVLAGETL